MSTSTQFQQLTKPTEATDLVDIDVLNANFDKIDKIGTVLCTSLTRPTTNLFAGLTIYETDTKLSYIYDGTGWDGVPGGRVGGIAPITASQAGITAPADITGSSFTFTPVNGRRYRFVWSGLGFFSSVVNDTYGIAVNIGGNDLAQARGNCNTSAGSIHSFSHSAEFIAKTAPGAIGSGEIQAGSVITCKLRGQRIFGTGSLTLNAGVAAPTQFWAEDMGT